MKALTKERLESIIERARGYIRNESDTSNPFNVISFCCEAGGIQTICVIRDSNTSEEVKDEIVDYHLFLNAVINRVASLEGESLGLNGTYYPVFNTSDGRNQVDIFLEAIGYRR